MKDCTNYDDPNCPKGLTSDSHINTPNLELLFVGCWGVYCKDGEVEMKTIKKGEVKISKETYGEKSVVESMTNYVNHNKNVNTVILAGDNIYSRSLTDEEELMITSKNWKEMKKAMYDMDKQFTLGFEQCMKNVPVENFLMALGNHDITTCKILNAQLNYDKWYLPAVYYNHIFITSTYIKVNIIVIDTNVYEGEDCKGKPYPEFTRKKQVDWVKDVIQSNKCEWNLIVGHIPAISNGYKNGIGVKQNLELVDDLISIKQYAKNVNLNVQSYMCADIHNQQLLQCRYPELPTLIIAGSGGTKLDDKMIITELKPCTIYAKATHGFVSLDINEDKMKIAFYSIDDEPSAPSALYWVNKND
jgi:hypothetical protein